MAASQADAEFLTRQAEPAADPFGGETFGGVHIRAGAMEDAAITAVANMAFRDSDPRFAMAVLVCELAREFDRSKSPGVADALARHLRYLADHADQEAGELDALRVRVAKKESAILIQRVNQQATGRPGHDG